MTVLLTKTKLTVQPNAGELNPHFTSSASQTSTPQFLHMVGPSSSVFVKVYKLVSGAWVLAFAGNMTVSDNGLAIGGANAPLRFQAVNGDAHFVVTDSAAKPVE